MKQSVIARRLDCRIGLRRYNDCRTAAGSKPLADIVLRIPCRDIRRAVLFLTMAGATGRMAMENVFRKNKRERAVEQFRKAKLDFAQFSKEFKRAKQAVEQNLVSPAQPVGTATPSPEMIVLSVCETNMGMMIGGKLYSFKGRKVVPKLVAFFQEMIETQDYCSASSFGIRTRDIEGQPDRIRELIESQPAAGTRIKPKWFN